jgi:hypothetical protein
MREPAVWKLIGEQIHQDFVTVHGDFQAGLTTLFGQLEEVEKASLSGYLEYLLQPFVTDEQRISAWAASGAAFSPTQSQAAEFLRQLYLLVRR